MQKENEIKKEIRTRIESATLLQKRNQRLNSGFSRFRKRGQSAKLPGKENWIRNQSLKAKLQRNQHVYQKDIKEFVHTYLNEDGTARKK